MFGGQSSSNQSASACKGWLMTGVSSWGENAEDAFDQCLVEMGLGDVRIIRAEGAMLPLGFMATTPEPLPMGSLVECHIATAYAWSGGYACAGVAWAHCRTPEGVECAIVATVSTEMDYEETTLLLRRNLQRRLASRDLEVLSFDMAVDEVTAGADHHGVVIAALILPDSLNLGSKTSTGPIRGGLTKSATNAMESASKRVDTKAPAAPALRPNSGSSDFSL